MNDSGKEPLLRTSEEGHRLAQLNILGNFLLSHADGRQLAVPTKKNRALLAILALSPGFQATRERLCGLLWGDRGEDQARGSLRQSLAVLRKELGEAESFLLQTRDDVVELRPDAIRVDAVEFLKLARANDLASLRPAATLYRGELLADTSMKGEDFDEWLSIDRRRLNETIIGVLDRLCALEIGPEQVETARRLVDLDPLREASHRALMRAHAEAGEVALALQQFEACRAILKAEFGVEPAAETQALRTAIAKGTFSKTDAAAGERKREEFDRELSIPTDKPSIAVLPFANLTGDPHQDFLCDGISQNITDDLARFHDLVVIASDSAFVYRNRNASIQAISQDLGARYLLQGSVVTSGNHLSIQARLVDGRSGQQVWSESYDGHPDSIFSLQDSVTKTIASTLATAYGGRLLKAWERRPDLAATRNMQAIDLFQRGMQRFSRFTKEETETARRLFHEAAQLDPNYAKPLAKIAWSHIIDCYFGWSSNPQASMKVGLEFARKAVSTDPDEPWAYWALSGYYQHKGDFERAIAGYEQALELNPNDADVVTDYGWCLSFAGRAEEGLAMAQRAMKLNPHHPDWYIFQFAQLQFNAKKYRDAVNTTKRLREVDTAGAQLYLAASYAALGEVKNAGMAVTRALELDPQASVERYTSREMAQYQVAADLDHFRDCLRKAGLPETSSSSLASMDEKPSIAVLPFANMSGNPEQDFFAEGITEDITTELSRFRQFKIQARTAAALFHGSEADALSAGRELGVRYFVTGSVRRLGQRLRISTQLVDAPTGSQVWAERFDRSEEDLFAVQDEVIRTIVSTLAGRAEAAGAEQIKRRHPGSLGAYECVLKAGTLPLYDHKSQSEARALYEKAIGLDPAYARPHAMLANLDVIDWMEDMSGSDAILDRALELAKKSVLLDDNDATCQMTLGAIYSNFRSFQLAEHHYQRAMDLNRNNPLVVATVGTLHLYRGDAVNAVKVFEEARILDPFFEPSWYWPTSGIARFALGQYHEAIALLERSPNRPHWVTAYLAASFALIGEEHRASQAAAETQRTLPSFLPERFTAKEWPPESDTGKKLLDGLRKAGFRNVK